MDWSITTVAKMQKVVAEKGAHQVGQVNSREIEMITQVGIIGASGLSLPPMWVFPRVRENPSKILANLLSGPMALAHKSGWIGLQIIL